MGWSICTAAWNVVYCGVERGTDVDRKGRTQDETSLFAVFTCGVCSVDINKTFLVEKRKKRGTWKGRRKRWQMDAYMTVEASFIMPMVLCIFVVVIYTSFYLYDRCVFQQDAYILCLRESIRRQEGAPAVDSERLKSSAKSQFGNKYFAVRSLEISTSGEGKNCVFEGKALVLPTSFGSDSLMPKKIWSVQFRARKRKSDPPWSIRSLRRKSHVLKSGAEYLQEQEN